MLACEGIAINSLFDYGMPTCTVRHSLAAHSHLASVSSIGIVLCGNNSICRCSLLFHACMQVLKEPQWRSFKFATDILTRKDVMQEGMRPCSRTGSTTVAATCQHRKEQRLSEWADLLHLYRKQQAACSALESHMHYCIQVLCPLNPHLVFWRAKNPSFGVLDRPHAMIDDDSLQGKPATTMSPSEPTPE
jgi:hypothetical protein